MSNTLKLCFPSLAWMQTFNSNLRLFLRLSHSAAEENGIVWKKRKKQNKTTLSQMLTFNYKTFLGGRPQLSLKLTFINTEMPQWIAFCWSQSIVEADSISPFVKYCNCRFKVLAGCVQRTMYSWSELSTYVEDRPVSKGPLLSVAVAMKSGDNGGTLPCYCGCVPRTRNQYSWFQRLFYSQGSSQLKCLFYSMTLLCKPLPTGSREQTWNK